MYKAGSFTLTMVTMGREQLGGVTAHPGYQEIRMMV